MNSKAKELAIHDTDTGSSEIQIALLTDKIETLSKHIKQFKKDKHSSVSFVSFHSIYLDFYFLKFNFDSTFL